VTFFAFTLLTFGAMQTKFIYMSVLDKVSGLYVPELIKLDIMECLVISSLLCSSDVIAAISIVKFDDQPQLFSIIFGEGIVNDAVALILF